MRINAAFPFQSTFVDYPDNESIAIVVYFMGCNKNCKECHNPHFKSPNYTNNTKWMSIEELVRNLEIACIRNKTNKVVFSGGDPLSEYNRAFVRVFLKHPKTLMFDIAIYTSYELEEVRDFNINGFRFLKCGHFDLKQQQSSNKSDDYLRFASKNQKLYDNKLKLLSVDGTYYFNTKERVECSLIQV